MNLEGVEEALRTSWRAPRAVDLFPEEPEAMAPSEDFKMAQILANRSEILPQE